MCSYPRLERDLEAREGCVQTGSSAFKLSVTEYMEMVFDLELYDPAYVA